MIAIRFSLTHDPNTRPTPKDMLAHRWIVKIMKMEVNMAKWVREVWGWPKPTRKSKDTFVLPMQGFFFSWSNGADTSIMAEAHQDRVQAEEIHR
jgi:hypothetical protein